MCKCTKVPPLIVVAMVYQPENDPDCVPTVCWTNNQDVPMFYAGAWEDTLDFLPEDCVERMDQHEEPTRWSWIFNRIPDSLEEIHAAIVSYLN